MIKLLWMRNMLIDECLFEALSTSCPDLHQNRLLAVLDVARALSHSQNLSLTALGRHLGGNSRLKNKIKKVDRLEGNKQLHKELDTLYAGLSAFVFKYISTAGDVPLIVDICCLKDDREIQMLSAEIAIKGRSIPLYREVIKDTEVKGRAAHFLAQLKNCLPVSRPIIVIMDAGFYEDWFEAIEALNWYWLCRIRQGRAIYLSESLGWQTVKNLLPLIPLKTTHYSQAFLTKVHQRACRVITTRRQPKGRKVKTTRGRTTTTVSNGSYSQSGREPWILATNLPASFEPIAIISLYFKRMQIEESFRDVKSHQFGLAARYVRTKSIHRWAVKMLLAAIVQITYWVIGVIAHSQGKQRYFQANTVRDRKVFSYFTLGKLMIEHHQGIAFAPDPRPLHEIIDQELQRDW